jgi:hypothetical protein
VVDGSTINNLTSLIIQSLVENGGLSEGDIAKKLIYFGLDGVTIFHGVKSGVTTQLMHKHAPFVNNVHYMPCHTNLVVQSLNKLSLVSKIESMLASIYNYFDHSPKRHVEGFLESKGNKILKNIKTYWISMLSPSKWVLAKYKALIVEMDVYGPTIDVAKKNYELFCDVETLLRLACVLPLLESM